MFYSDVYDDFNLFITPDKFYICPKLSSKYLVVDRVSESLSLQSNVNDIPVATSSREFCGLLGSVRLLAGQYLIIATKRTYVGSIAGHAVWCLVSSELIPYNRSTLHLNAEQLDDNNSYLSMIKNVLDTPYLYFSYTYDLTHTMQRLHLMEPDFLNRSLFERADHRFVWNSNLIKQIFRLEIHNFCLPLLHGFMAINDFSINGYNFTWTVISRRSINRPGTRLFRRGLDNVGNVANFVETEQIVECQGDRASFVQIRGSIPLYWSQYPDLRYKPPPHLVDVAADEQQSACARHLDSLSVYYGRQVLLDLVDQRGSEGKLQKAYADTVQALGFPFVRYEPFDFHSECRHMRWDRLSILLDRISLEQDDMGFFLLLRDGSIPLLQDGVFRTNCVDCLDRTNVVQSMIARRCLGNILHKLSIIKSEESIEEFPSLERVFKEVWADNADLISLQYSGTGALKTDFTRTGKRTHVGLMRDGLNSLTRYYKNNFSDGFRQDAIDLFHGIAEIKSPLRIERGWKYITFPSVLLVAIAMFVACAILPSEYSTDSLLFILFWGVMVTATLTTILNHGPEFVDQPRLTVL
ncbi:phosphatidylinositide phosphatase SAC1-like isoform X2 [Photinus pyralis]|uniref:phosphatidylinositide phosphatase SAC1-like isoform X2 n=1 Tax=Photinus pyralis TaxID=7054 RepID=UPI001267483C|nr:phosphatidylinositide phosphatase SAC1-like isoform X2 [Photinus pyralis]